MELLLVEEVVGRMLGVVMVRAKVAALPFALVEDEGKSAGSRRRRLRDFAMVEGVVVVV